MSRPVQELTRTMRTPAGREAVTADDVAVASALWLAYAIGAGVLGWMTAPTVLAVLSPLLLLGAIVGFVALDAFIYRAQEPPKVLMALSLGGYAWIVGSFTWAYSGGGGLGLVGAAAVGTVTTAALVITLYKTGVIKARNHKFRSMVAVAGVGYLIVIGVSLLVQVFGGGSLFGNGLLGMVLCLFGTSLAAVTLTLAVADMDIAIEAGVPREEASRLGWAFVGTLTWLFAEMMRLMAVLRD